MIRIGLSPLGRFFAACTNQQQEKHRNFSLGVFIVNGVVGDFMSIILDKIIRTVYSWHQCDNSIPNVLPENPIFTTKLEVYFNPFEKICERQIGSSPQGDNKNTFELPPRSLPCKITIHLGLWQLLYQPTNRNQPATRPTTTMPPSSFNLLQVHFMILNIQQEATRKLKVSWC